MGLKDFIVKKPFLSHDSKRLYTPGQIYNGGDSFHTRQLLKYDFIEEPMQIPSKDENPAFGVFMAWMTSLLKEGDAGK